NTPPDAVDDTVTQVPGTSLFIDVLGNDTDADGDALGIIGVTQGSQGEVVIDNDQILYLRNTSGPAVFPGDSFTYTVGDGNGGQDTATVTIAPESTTSGPPVIAPLADLLVDEFDFVDVAISATDPDGNGTIALSAELLRPNGQPVNPSKYALVDNGDGTGQFTWSTPSRNFDGTYTANITADDGENPAVVESFTVLVNDLDDDTANTPPDAVDDTVTQVPGTSLFIDVLGNDTDADGDALGIIGVTQGSQGEVVIDNDQILYLRNTSGPAVFPGDSFTYTVGDGNGGQDTATVTIAPESTTSGPPVIAPLADLLVDEFDFVDVAISATDPDGNGTIALSAELLRPNGQPVNPSKYALVDNGDGTGQFTWSTPSRNFDGTYTANITADDGENPAVVESFTVLVNDLDDDTANTPEILYRVNAGGGNLSATDGGPDWGQDTAAVNSPYLAENGSNSTASPGISGGTSLPDGAPRAVFESHRWDQPDAPEMTWEFDLPDDGFYNVRLFIRNSWNGTSEAGERVFDVELEGSVPAAFEDIDPSGMFGHRVGGVVEAVVEVTDGTLGIEFQHQVQNPLVNAIEITTTEDMFGV
ncbi:Ig-like domain-containing protein, partial [Amaricoccus tamworthensis]|uniref:Ig-like domain-containing protein n=1 Tax=Amaricoccus tamworthensis TaxID=57002 RepID=UPI003C7B9B85